jgi:carboxymethylenebutenolidase
MTSSPIQTSRVDLGGGISAVEAKPTGSAPWPGVLVIHGGFGLMDYVSETVARFAENGYTSLAVDMFDGKLYEPGKMPRSGDEFDDDVCFRKIAAGLDYLGSRDYCTGRVGVMGFCRGGGLSLSTACSHPNQVQACAVFYGMLDSVDPLQALRAPVVASYGSLDPRTTPWGTDHMAPALGSLGIPLDIKVYEGAPHGFFDPHNPEVYRAEASEDSFARTLNTFQNALLQPSPA